MVKFITSVYTNQGARSSNQDFADFSDRRDRFGIWGLADGLGGHAHGDVAARVAVQRILRDFSSSPDLYDGTIAECFLHANEEILGKQEDPEFSDMRTTCTCLFTDYRKIRFAHIGDTRLYHFSEGAINSVTADHSVSYAAYTLGEIPYHEIRFHADRNKLYRSLGNSKELRIQISDVLPLKQGDAFLLCTDGFWESVYEDEMVQALSVSATPDIWISKMLTIHNRRISATTDNYSAIAVFVRKSGFGRRNKE